MDMGRCAALWLVGGLTWWGPALAVAHPVAASPASPWRKSQARLVAQVSMPDPPPPEPATAAPVESAPGGGSGSSGPVLGAEGSSRQAAGGKAAASGAAVPAVVEPPRKPFPKENLFGFGLMVGQPTGLTLQARFLGRNAVVGSVGWDFLYQSVTLSLDYRFTFFNWDFIRYDTVLGFFAGAGVRVGTFEPVKQYLRQLPVTPGFRLPVGATLRLRQLPLEFALVVSPIGFDVKEVALAFPRWRPEATLEVRADFPFAPF